MQNWTISTNLKLNFLKGMGFRNFYQCGIIYDISTVHLLITGSKHVVCCLKSIEVGKYIRYV